MTAFPIVDDIRAEMFPGVLIDSNFKPTEPANGFQYQRVVVFHPPTEGHFEELLVAWKPYEGREASGTPTCHQKPILDWDLKRSSMEERKALGSRGGSYWRIMTRDEATAFEVSECRRRQLWANLADGLSGVAEHNVQQIASELALTETNLSELRGRMAKVSKLVGTVSGEELQKAKDQLRDFQEKYKPGEIDDSRRLSQRDEELRAAIEKIKHGQKQLKEIQKNNPLLFQSQEERKRFQPHSLQASTGNTNVEPRTSPTKPETVAALAERPRKSSAG